MSFIVVVRRLRVRILTSVFFLNKISKFFFAVCIGGFPVFSFSYMNLDFVCVWEVQSTKIFGHCWVLRPSQNQSTFRLHDFFSKRRPPITLEHLPARRGFLYM